MWNQPFNLKSVLDLDIIKLYFDCTLAITPNVSTNNLMQHIVLVAPYFDFFEKNEKYHHLRHPYVLKYIKVGVLQLIVICDNSLKKN